MMDRERNVISVSGELPSEVIRFTGAHEVGHWVLHKQQVMHRDRPISGPQQHAHGRDLYEREADFFSGCFLMPRRLVEQYYEEAFGERKPFIFNTRTCALLCPYNPDLLRSSSADTLEKALVLAKAERYGDKRFTSLASSFRVSPKAMAIRLTELGLVED